MKTNEFFALAFGLISGFTIAYTDYFIGKPAEAANDNSPIYLTEYVCPSWFSFGDKVKQLGRDGYEAKTATGNFIIFQKKIK